MSKHAIDRAGWSPEERDEYEEVLAEVVGASKDTTVRLDLFEHKLLDAIQAHRPWAREVERACARTGMAKEISRYQARTKVQVSYEGQVVSMPAVQAKRVTDADGHIGYQRELIELWTWEQIAAKRLEALQARRTYDNKVAHYDRLLALRVLAPEASTPAEAAEAAGVPLDEFLTKTA